MLFVYQSFQKLVEQLVLVEQYRPPLDAHIIELCAGLAGDVPGKEDEPLEDAARRELLEECGYDAEHLEFLTEGPPAQGLCDEFLTFFKATGLLSCPLKTSHA